MNPHLQIKDRFNNIKNIINLTVQTFYGYGILKIRMNGPAVSLTYLSSQLTNKDSMVQTPFKIWSLVNIFD